MLGDIFGKMLPIKYLAHSTDINKHLRLARLLKNLHLVHYLNTKIKCTKTEVVNTVNFPNYFILST